MVKTLLVKIDLYTCTHNLVDIASTCPLHQFGICPERNHHTNVNTCKGCSAHGQEHRFRRQEIRGLDIDIPFGFQQDAYIPLHDIRPLGYWTACYNLHQAIISVEFFHLRVITTVGNQRTIHEIPVNQESTLNAIYRSTPDAQMGVTPRSSLGFLTPFLLSDFATLHIPRGDIHATEEPYHTIYHT